MRAGGDVEEDHLVRALIVVAQGELHWVAYIAEPAFLGAPKLHAASDFSIMHVEAGDYAFCQHCGDEMAGLCRGGCGCGRKSDSFGVAPVGKVFDLGGRGF